jgi:hypothetical protein
MRLRHSAIQGTPERRRRKAATFSEIDARLIVQNRGFPSHCSLSEKISLPATAAGGHHAKWKRHKKES